MSQFNSIQKMAEHLRDKLEGKKCALLFAYNGVGKTRLSMEFKDLGRDGDNRDTLYFNAFTEDLFTWDNDLDGDRVRALKLNSQSRFFAGMRELEMDNRIRPLLNRYADFDFKIDVDSWAVRFSRNTQTGDGPATMEEDIKISRGEENIFIWCFFLVIVQLSIDKDDAYSWVKYIYIDDPVSSLDENNTVAVARDLAQMIQGGQNSLKVLVSSHHTLFFDVLCHEIKRPLRFFLSKNMDGYNLKAMQDRDAPFFYHVAMLAELLKAAESGELYTYHFNILRSILEKAASFHGYEKFSDCIRKDQDEGFHARMLNLLSHGNYSLYEPTEMLSENKEHFKRILNNFVEDYKFNPEALSVLTETATEVE